MSHDEDIDARLARLASATQGVRPRPDFSSRVESRIREEQLRGLLALGVPARRLLPLGMLTAALALVWAATVNSQLDEWIASGDEVELSW